MKKVLFSCVVLALLVSFSSCINDAEIKNYTDQEVPKGIGNLEFIINSSETASSTKTRSAEHSGTTEMGSENEYKISNLTVYLFNSSDKKFVEKIDLTGIKEESKEEKNVRYSADKVTVDEGNYDIFAIANSSLDISGSLITEDKFLAKIDENTYCNDIVLSEKGFVMTNRAANNLEVNIPKSSSTSNTIYVTLKMERVVAKINVAKGNEEYEMKKPGSQSDPYASISLGNFAYVNIPTSYYLFRHVAQMDQLSNSAPTFTLDNNFGNIADGNGYVIDPYFFKKQINASGFNNPDGYYRDTYWNFNTNITWKQLNVNNYTSFYGLENTMYKEAQKNGYTTGLIFKATVTPNKNHIWKYDDATDKNVLTDLNVQPIYYCNYNFYTSLKALKKAGIDVDLNKNYSDDELAKFNVKCLHYDNGTSNYVCYYKYWIKHLEDNKSGIMSAMEFGIVRNNSYYINITNINEIGEDKPIIKPDEPDDNKSFLDITIVVDPWIVRDQTSAEL